MILILILGSPRRSKALVSKNFYSPMLSPSLPSPTWKVAKGSTLKPHMGQSQELITQALHRWKPKLDTLTILCKLS